jgi:hypothetical protein
MSTLKFVCTLLVTSTRLEPLLGTLARIPDAGKATTRGEDGRVRSDLSALVSPVPFLPADRAEVAPR